MSPYRTIITVGEPGQIVLTNVPVKTGDRVEVVVRPCDLERQRRSDAFQQLLKDTKALPQLKNLTEADITAEVAAFRNGQ